VFVPVNAIEMDAMYEVAGSGNSGGKPWTSSKIEILNACKGTLYKRTTTVTQWGYLFVPGSDYPMSRRGELYWGGLKGDCPAPVGTVWFMSCPNHGAAMVGGNAYNSLSSFESEHPAWRFPEDYWDVAKGIAATLPNSLRPGYQKKHAPDENTPAAKRRKSLEDKILNIDTGGVPRR
ncbi:MAG: hypothetical protein ABI877_19410, partial [Gemmatimonadaceae bacterium]